MWKIFEKTFSTAYIASDDLILMVLMVLFLVYSSTFEDSNSFEIRPIFLDALKAFDKM